jgi:arabinan endo-1,5-alpha-L-arabinosidase
MRTSEIQIRDPFIVPVASKRRYYLCGTTDRNCWDEQGGVGFDGYWSTDLEEWQGPFPLFRPPAGFWATGNFWAPEMHCFRGQYYLLASFKAPGVCRGTQVLLSAGGPLGPYLPISDGPVTPPTWECLDGTLFVDDADVPWMIFCHEWLQVNDGGMCAIRLTDDLTRAVGEPETLFTASSATWVRPTSWKCSDGTEKRGLVTDGPYLVRSQGRLLLLWSSFGVNGYAMGIAHSASGTLRGPWRQQAMPLYGKDGGHGMIFHTFDGRPMLTLHTPNVTPHERPVFLPLRETEETLIV